MKRHLLLWAALLTGACASEGQVGDSCGAAGKSAGECASGAICTNTSGGKNYCRKVCTEQKDCAATEACNGVSGSSTKSCQPK
ncbi:MAG: hypothetical protein FJ100_13070 [Deltaproteobacteria bacterium]|nr:hypothetical protein [Deltaproteobacteria bacterium]